jgi:hypothetical protein
MPAILLLLLNLAPLIPTLSAQIEHWVQLFQQKGKLTPEQQAAVHTLALEVHAEVLRLVAARTNPAP